MELFGLPFTAIACVGTNSEKNPLIVGAELTAENVIAVVFPHSFLGKHFMGIV